MPFHIVQLNPATGERIVSVISFSTLKEATDEAEKGVRAFEGEHGFDSEQDFWWCKDETGKVTQIYIES